MGARFLIALIISPWIRDAHALSLSEAQQNPDNHVIVCERPEALGLYKQCYEGVVLQKLGNTVRVYSQPEKRVATAKPEQIFVRSSTAEAVSLKAGQTVAIPGRFLWNTSPDGFQSLCQIDALNSASHYLTVSCGRYQGEKILKSHALPLKAWAMDSKPLHN